MSFRGGSPSVALPAGVSPTAGVTFHSCDASHPRPHLAVVGAIHGNEHCGLQAIYRLADELARGELALRAGSLYLVHGNPAASQQQRRHTPLGVDLNRMFDFRFVEELAPELWQHEHTRALELRTIFDSVDAVLDLHSATAPTPAFAIASRVPASLPFALALGLEYVTSGWDGPGLLGDQVLLGRLTRRELPGVAVECGQHEDDAAVDVAYQCTLRALSYFGLIEPPLAFCLRAEQTRAATRKQLPVKQLTVRAAIKCPSVSFRFERPLRGMQPLVPGELIGHDEHLTLSVRNACYAIMPNDRVAVGDDMLYIAD